MEEVIGPFLGHLLVKCDGVKEQSVSPLACVASERWLSKPSLKYGGLGYVAQDKYVAPWKCLIVPCDILPL